MARSIEMDSISGLSNAPSQCPDCGDLWAASERVQTNNTSAIGGLEDWRYCANCKSDLFFPVTRIKMEINKQELLALVDKARNDNGAALKLAVLLKIDFLTEGNASHAGFYTEGTYRQQFLSESQGSDPEAATRRAIANAATKIANQMPDPEIGGEPIMPEQRKLRFVGR